MQKEISHRTTENHGSLRPCQNLRVFWHGTLHSLQTRTILISIYYTQSLVRGKTSVYLLKRYDMDITKEIANDIKELYIDCPDCEYMTDDEQYTCTTCWCEGGNGRINAVKWIQENPNHFK